MGTTFSKVVYDPNQAEIAKVNRVDKTLYLNGDIWKGLPVDQREFVLLHEEGHLQLQTADEFEANSYAVGKFAPVRTLTNAELGQRIIVMRNILTPRTAGFDIGGIIGSVGDSLSVLGVGSKSRVAEAEAQAKADQKKANSTMIMSVLAGVFLIVGIVIYFTFKK